MLPSKLAWAAAPLLLFAGVSLAQTSSIQGEVKGEDGKPLQGALIRIERKDIKGNYQVKTKRKGDYFHAGLPLGTYDIILEVDGKVRDRVSNVRTTLGDPRVINFDMQALRQKQDALQKAAETGTLTQEQAREMTAEQREAYQRQLKERSAAMAKNKALNDAFNAGMQALQEKRFDAAVESLLKASELDPKQYAVWAHLGDAYKELSSTKTGAEQDAIMNKSLESYAKALELKPDDAASHNNYALALAKAKKFPEAQAELQKAAELDPKEAGKYYFNLGALLVNSGQYEPAAEAFKKAIEADPNYAEAHYQYGLCLMAKATTTPEGKMVPPPGTREEFEKYLQLRPTGPNSDAAKAFIASMETTIQTQYLSPEAQKQQQKKKKK
jgi:tetratricopeptide (TPR) repeat protein